MIQLSEDLVQEAKDMRSKVNDVFLGHADKQLMLPKLIDTIVAKNLTSEWMLNVTRESIEKLALSPNLTDNQVTYSKRLLEILDIKIDQECLVE